MLKVKCVVCRITKTCFLPAAGIKRKGDSILIPFPFVDVKKLWNVGSDKTLFKDHEVLEGWGNMAKWKRQYADEENNVVPKVGHLG